MSFIVGFIVGGLVTYYRVEINEWFESLEETKKDKKDKE